MKKNILKWGFVGVLSVALISCGGKEENNENTNDHNVNADSLAGLDSLEDQGPFIDPNVSYSVPTPNELFTIIKETGVAFDPSILNSTENAGNYTNKKIQALNFGVYSADLAFTSSYEISTDALKYFAVIKKLGDDLDIANAFDETVFQKVEESIEKGQSDSLMILSNDTYFEAYSYLEENDRGSTLALIVLGGWIESLYIMTNLGEYEEGGVLVDRIAEQKLTLENLMGFLMKYENDSDVMEVMEGLAEIEGLFWELEVEEGEDATTELEGDMYVMSGGGKIVVSQEQYNELKELVKALRMEIVEGEI